MAARGKVLIVDDDESMRIACAQALEQTGFSVASAADGEQALAIAFCQSFDVALLDLRMPGPPGMEVLRRLKQDSPNLMVIIMTGYPTIDSAVEAVKSGAYNYLPKPFTPEALTAIVSKAVTARRRVLEYACISEELERKMLSEEMIGSSEGMKNVVRLIRKAAPGDSTVLITGETGVGKEVVARAIHRLSGRSKKPFVTVDCGALVESLFESELFGRRRVDRGQDRTGGSRHAPARRNCQHQPANAGKSAPRRPGTGILPSGKCAEEESGCAHSLRNQPRSAGGRPRGEVP